ncbi:MAG: serine/threonine protein kinase [Pirellula sp.]|nr:serine/threonine protein kinase [Pirellula sp.]
MIFHDKPDQRLCDDDKLIAVLNDGDQSAEHQEVIDHIEQCPRCQQRFDELAAGAQDWTKVRQALLNDDPCSENRVGSAKWDYSLRNEGPVAWTESMASQLLSPASHPELLGRIGRYDVERLIGSGGMGVVFKAHDSELNRPVAIKILAPYLSGSGPARKRFAREARAAAAVVHEHVVPIYNVETEREIPFLVMHFIAGESLQGRIDRQGALELCEILRIGMQVASGLSAAHQQGLVHRDIKPSNILMEQGVERALITDFGLARAADDASLTRTGFHPGTPQYMSPEQAAGEQVDARSDLFSLGSVLYTMCTGRPPFRAETSLGVLRRITDVEPRPIREINPNIPEWLSSLVARLMSKSSEDRFANALEVADLLGQCLAHVQQPAGMPLPVAVATTAPIRDRRPPIGKFIAAAAFAMALVFAGVFIVLESNKGTLTIQSDADDIRVRITQGDEVIDELKVTKSGQSVRVAAGQYKRSTMSK